MYLFILESIGTPELILIGIVALMFLGPRKLPQMAKKAGKIMSEFRGTASEFRETWQREANFEEEAKAFNLDDIESETLPRERTNGDAPASPSAPAIKEADPSQFAHLKNPDARDDEEEAAKVTEAPTPEQLDKKNWY